MTIKTDVGLSNYWAFLHDTQHLALHATIYTWAAAQTPSGCVLDLGCEYGFGSLLVTQTNPGLKVQGMDLDLASIQYTQNLPFGTRVPRINADAHNLPVAAESFSGIYLINILHLVREPGRVLAEVKRGLITGGIAVISIPLKNPGESRSTGSELSQELELELKAQFALVTYPQEIYGKIPSFPPQSFPLDQQRSVWIALCRKG